MRSYRRLRRWTAAANRGWPPLEVLEAAWTGFEVPPRGAPASWVESLGIGRRPHRGRRGPSARRSLRSLPPDRVGCRPARRRSAPADYGPRVTAATSSGTRTSSSALPRGDASHRGAAMLGIPAQGPCRACELRPSWAVPAPAFRGSRREGRCRRDARIVHDQTGRSPDPNRGPRGAHIGRCRLGSLSLCRLVGRRGFRRGPGRDLLVETARYWASMRGRAYGATRTSTA